MPAYLVDPMPPAVPVDLAAKLAQVELATIGHFRHRGFVHRSVAQLWPGPMVVGTAVTLAIPGPDSTLLHHAIGLLRPGDVLVIDRLGDDRHACLGGGVAFAAKAAGAAAAIIDGPCTDPGEIREVGLAVWCRGASAITTRLLDLGGALNRPIACGNVPVLPGDVVLGDETGVLVLPVDEADAVAEEAVARQARAGGRRGRIAAGEKLGELSGASDKVRGGGGPPS